MQKWEFKVITTPLELERRYPKEGAGEAEYLHSSPGELFDRGWETVGKLGRQGWELVAVVPLIAGHEWTSKMGTGSGSSYTEAFFFFLKRPLPEEI